MWQVFFRRMYLGWEIGEVYCNLTPSSLLLFMFICVVLFVLRLNFRMEENAFYFQHIFSVFLIVELCFCPVFFFFSSALTCLVLFDFLFSFFSVFSWSCLRFIVSFFQFVMGASNDCRSRVCYQEVMTSLMAGYNFFPLHFTARSLHFASFHLNYFYFHHRRIFMLCFARTHDH